MLKGEAESIQENSPSPNVANIAVASVTAAIVNNNLPPSLSEINDGKVHVDSNGGRSKNIGSKSLYICTACLLCQLSICLPCQPACLVCPLY